MRKVLAAAVFVLASGAVAGCGSAAEAPPEPIDSTSSALSQCVGTTVKGVDVYEFDLPIDWNKLKSEGYEFAIVKATESTTSDQHGTFPGSYAGAKAAGLVVGAYHFFRGNVSGVAQANWFLSVAGSHLVADDLPVSLDIETTDGATGAEITQRMWDFIHTVEQKTGKKPIIYTYSSYFSSAGVDTTGLDKYPLWLAPAHNGATCFDSGGFTLPWASAAIWQFDSSTPLGGISNTAADRDQFIGTLAQLKAFASGAGTASPQVNGNGAMSVVTWPANGDVELFVTGTDGSAKHVYTPTGGTQWSTPATYNGKAACGLASALRGESSGGSYAQVYGPSVNGGATEELHLAPSQKGKWSDFADFGGAGLSQLSTAVAPDGHVEVFGLAGDGSIEVNAYDPSKDTWSGWKPIGGSVATGAAPIAHDDGTLEIFATDAQGAAWHATRTTSGTWGAWASLGGKLSSRPVPIRYPDGHLEIVARGTDGYTWSSEWSKSWPAFAPIESTTAIAGEVSAVMNGGGRPELFARGTDQTILHMFWDFGKMTWTAWAPVGAATQMAASDPLGWVRPDGTADVFAVDPAGNLVTVHRDASNKWGAWASIATGIDACVASASVPPPQVDGGPASGPDAGAPDASTTPGETPPQGPGITPGATGSTGGCSMGNARSRESAGEGLVLAWLAAMAAMRWGRRRSRPREDAPA